MQYPWIGYVFFNRTTIVSSSVCPAVQSCSLYVLFLREEAFWGPPPLGPKSYARLPGFRRRWRRQHNYTAGGRSRAADDDSVESVRTMCRHHLLAVLQPLIAVQVSQCLTSFKLLPNLYQPPRGLGHSWLLLILLLDGWDFVTLMGYTEFTNIKQRNCEHVCLFFGRTLLFSGLMCPSSGICRAQGGMV